MTRNVKMRKINCISSIKYEVFLRILSPKILITDIFGSFFNTPAKNTRVSQKMPKNAGFMTENSRNQQKMPRKCRIYDGKFSKSTKNGEKMPENAGFFKTGAGRRRFFESGIKF